METQNDSDAAASCQPSRHMSTAIASLIGALIGALAGATGSLLVYKQSANNLKANEMSHTADVRRAAFSSFIAQADTVYGDFVEFTNGVRAGDNAADLESRYQSVISPDLIKLSQTDSLALLVATSSDVQAAAIRVGEAESAIYSLVIGPRAMVDTNRQYYDGSTYAAEIQSFSTAIRDFTSAAKKEVGAS
ncbi:hypothetical protein ACFC1R_22705 [Kitasatospora sp. NPDC056138]|uniref:hypothetical protein n=1 Tax=Kitasatospora sp. NPDC056138 TaxID=3345724 RepID=UPI0035D7537B